MSKLFGSFLILLLVIVGILFLEIYLSNKKNKYLGLIISFITFIFSILAILGINLFSISEVVMNEKKIMNYVNNFRLATLLISIYIFILYNIPTVILTGVYLGCREKIKKSAELKKINIKA